MNILIAMLLTSFTNFGRKIWGQDLVDKAVESVIIYAAEKYCAWTHTTADDEWLELVKSKLAKSRLEDKE